MRYALLLLLCASTCFAGDLNLGDDEWQSWRFVANDGSRESCCYYSSHHKERQSGCRLDAQAGRLQMTSSDERTETMMRAYVRQQRGVLQEVHVYSESCPVSAASDINDLGVIDQAQSLTWFRDALEQHPNEASALILGIAHHAGDEARSTLQELTNDAQTRAVRRDALFWIAVQRGDEAQSFIEAFIASEHDTGLRKHAVFSLAQIDNATSALLKLLTNENEDMQVRKQALFWLAQSDSPQAFQAIDALLVPES